MGLPAALGWALNIPTAFPAAVESVNSKTVLSCSLPELSSFAPHQHQVLYLKVFKYAKLSLDLYY